MSLAAGITDFFSSVIDGSKSAEEAFVDMLKGMAAALIQQGAQMIAQYMAIALAKAIAGMGSSTFGYTRHPDPKRLWRLLPRRSRSACF